MTKVFKEPDSYIQRVLKRFITRMNPSSWEDSEEPTPPGPEPGELVAFSVGQTISAFDFGDFENGDINEEMQAFLDGLTYGQDEEVILLSATAGGVTATLRARALGGGSNCALYAYMGDTGTPLYENGYKGLTDGKFVFGATATCESVNDTTPPTWNGVLIGAVVSQ